MDATFRCTCWRCTGKAHDDGTLHVSWSDNIARTYVPADPLTVEEDWAAPLTHDRSRDILIACIAGMVIIAVLAYWAGTRA